MTVRNEYIEEAVGSQVVKGLIGRAKEMGFRPVNQQDGSVPSVYFRKHPRVAGEETQGGTQGCCNNAEPGHTPALPATLGNSGLAPKASVSGELWPESGNPARMG